MLQLKIDRATGSVQCQHHQTRDDGGQREGQVDHRVDETFAGEVVGLDPLELLQSGDWVSGWRDDKRLGVIYVYPSIAGPYLKATS